MTLVIRKDITYQEQLANFIYGYVDRHGPQTMMDLRFAFLTHSTEDIAVANCVGIEKGTLKLTDDYKIAAVPVEDQIIQKMTEAISE